MNTVLIVEDEQPAAKRIEKLLLEIDKTIEIVGHTDSVTSTVNWLNQNPHPSLIMLDIQLGDGISFEIFKQINTQSFIIFTTAYDEFALKAFELNSIDYLLKPIKKEQLSKAFEKFIRVKGVVPNFNIDEIINFIENKKESRKNRFVINIGHKLVTIETKNIACFYSMEKYSFLSTFEGRSYPVDFSLDNIENMVDPSLYFRINRQQLIHYNAIKAIHVLSKSRIKLELNIKLEEDLYVSYAKSSDFRKWLDR